MAGNYGDDNDNGNDIITMIMASTGKWGHIEADATWSGMVAQVLTKFSLIVILLTFYVKCLT